MSWYEKKHLDPRDIKIAFRRHGDEALWFMPPRSNPEWMNLRLTLHGRGRKRYYYLGWNGKRLARGRDLAFLADKHPDVLQWVEAGLREKWSGGQWRPLLIPPNRDTKI
ncbi:MAG: hypothetical protein Q8P46_06905 [Hyphomicrobiales bacterium]|nr:hypothetical protein [Hyphomicrobiales bacterium]